MKKFLVCKNESLRLRYIKKIKGKKVVIYNKENSLLKYFDVAIDMRQLMNNEYFFQSISQCDGNTTLVLMDILIKNGVYAHPYGKVYKFCETAGQTLIIDSFAFKWNEKQIVRPFLFINPNILGSSMINFWEGKENLVENYAGTVKEFIQMEVSPIKIINVNYTPTPDEYAGYNKLKKALIDDFKNTKSKIVNALIKYVDETKTKEKAIEDCKMRGLKVISNKPKNKFSIYESLANEDIDTIIFFSSKMYGADEIEMTKTKKAIERHNVLIKLLNGTKKV